MATQPGVKSPLVCFLGIPASYFIYTLFTVDFRSPSYIPSFLPSFLLVFFHSFSLESTLTPKCNRLFLCSLTFDVIFSCTCCEFSKYMSDHYCFSYHILCINLRLDWLSYPRKPLTGMDTECSVRCCQRFSNQGRTEKAMEGNLPIWHGFH